MVASNTQAGVGASLSNLHVSGHPLVRDKIRMLADRRTDPKLFRELVKELTALMVYEATADLPVRTVTFQTPLEEAAGIEVTADIGLVPILRAGLGMTDAALMANFVIVAIAGIVAIVVLIAAWL